MTNKETVSNFPQPLLNSQEKFSVPASPASSVTSFDDSNQTTTITNFYEPPSTPGAQERLPSKPSSSGKKRMKRSTSSNGDDDLLSVINDMNKATKDYLMCEKEPTTDNENMLFCKSLAPILDRLPKRDAALAKMNIQKVLFDLEFKDS